MSARTRHVALLRGINVGKNKRIAMADLRALLTDLGFADVQTLLQSGNAVFTAPPRATPGSLEKRLAKAIAERFGFEVSVIVRTAGELAKIVEQNPLPAATHAGSKFHVLFLSAEPEPAALRDADPAALAPEEFVVAGREIYLWCTNGVLESKLFTVFSDKRLKVVTTARNWNTVTKLVAKTRET